MRMNLHLLFRPFSGLFLNLAYLSKMSEWRKKHSALTINDFYNGKWDYSSRLMLYQKVFAKENLSSPVNYLEFGVSKGASFKWWIEHNKNPESEFVGFDTFTGLPEDWNVFKAGAMSAGGNFPVINDNRATFIKGLFQDTLSPFLKTFNNDKRKIIHLDADLYTSTLYTLATLHPFIKAGDILFFDEFAVPQHEFLAFKNYVDSFRVSYEVIGAMNNYYFLAVKIL